PVAAGQLGRLLDELRTGPLKARIQAADALVGMGELAEPALRQALAGKPDAQLREQLESILRQMQERGPPPQLRRDLRAVEVLERIGTAEARLVLRLVARRAPAPPPTRPGR